MPANSARVNNCNCGMDKLSRSPMAPVQPESTVDHAILPASTHEGDLPEAATNEQFTAIRRTRRTNPVGPHMAPTNRDHSLPNAVVRSRLGVSESVRTGPRSITFNRTGPTTPEKHQDRPARHITIEEADDLVTIPDHP